MNRYYENSKRYFQLRALTNMKISMSSATGKVIAVLIVFAVAYAAKDYYRSADHESLEWLLAPTAFLVECVSGIGFDDEPGLGWVNGVYGVAIAPSCSGMNYLIILFCMSSFSAVLRLGSLKSLVCWFGFSVFTSYGFTLIVNSLRIWLAIVLYDVEIYSAALTAESVHRLAGVLIYYSFMVFYYLAVSFILNLITGREQCLPTGSYNPRHAAGLLWPLGCYLFLTIVMPYLRGSVSGQHFPEHVRVVVGVSVGLTIFLGLGVGSYFVLVGRLRSFHAGRQHSKA